MPIRQYRPTSPGRRGMSVSTFEEITKTKPEKSLVVKLKKHSGRNNQGRITTRHRGGGAKRAYRLIDFKRNKQNVPAKVAAIEYDPNRSARIALLHYLDGEKRYIIAPLGLKVGDQVMAGPEADIKAGNALPLKNIPTGTTIHNIELTKGRGGQMVRGAGAGAQLMAKEGDYALIRLPSGEQRKVHILCNIDGYMRLTIMDADCHSHHLGEDCRSTRPGLDNTAVATSDHSQYFLPQGLMNIWPFFS